MGLRIVDQYSLLHFAVGIIAYFWSVSLLLLVIVHILFEYIENTQWGMKIINNYFIRWWPGGKTHPNNLVNKTSDTLFSIFGWLIANYLDKLYSYDL
jgi:hypothetical protein